MRDTTTDDNRTRGGAVGVVCAAVRESGLRGKTGGWGDLALRGNAGKPCGPKRSADAARRCRDRGKHPHKMKSAKAWIAAKRGDRGK